MTLPDMAFTPADGLKNATSFPDPETPGILRAQVQTPSDQLRDFINSSVKPEVNAKENREITYVAVTTSRTLTADDLYKWIIATHATVPIVLTVPKDLTTEDAWIAIEQGGAAQVSVAAATDVTIKPATKLKVNGQDTAAVLTHRSGTPNTWGWQGSVKA
jgi:hypothetical protein